MLMYLDNTGSRDRAGCTRTGATGFATILSAKRPTGRG
jgi:hypothetical protein